MELEKRSCPVCGSKDDSKVFAEANYDENNLNDFSFASRKFPELMHLKLVLCPECNLLYSISIPRTGYLENAYKQAQYDSQVESQYASHTYIKHLAKILPKLPELRGALDIGAGDGAFLERLLEVGFKDVIGVEPSESPIQAAKEQIREMIIKGFFSPQNYKPQSFSLITCFQTIEHMSEPKAVCRDSYDLLKTGGAFFTVSHNYRSFSAKILGKKSPIFDIEHLQLFSPKSIRFLLEHTGFTNVKVYSIVNSYALTYWVRLLPMNITLKKHTIEFIKKIGLAGLPLPMPAGNMVAIGYKR